MQKNNKNTKTSFLRDHHVRVSALAIAMATGLHVSGAAHIKQHATEQVDKSISLAHALNQHLERENETARHMVRFDAGLRLPSTSGGEV